MKWAQVDVWTAGPNLGRVQTCREGGYRVYGNVTRASIFRLARVFARHHGRERDWHDGWAWYFEGDEAAAVAGDA